MRNQRLFGSSDSERESIAKLGLTAAGEKGFVINRLRREGLEALPAGLEKASGMQLRLLGYDPKDIVTSHGVKAIPIANSVDVSNYNDEFLRKNPEVLQRMKARAAELATQLNAMAERNKGDTEVFKAMDKEYKGLKAVTSPASYRAKINPEFNKKSGIVTDATGDHFNLNSLVGKDSATRLFGRMKTFEMSAGEMYHAAASLKTLIDANQHRSINTQGKYAVVTIPTRWSEAPSFRQYALPEQGSAMRVWFEGGKIVRVVKAPDAKLTDTTYSLAEQRFQIAKVD